MATRVLTIPPLLFGLTALANPVMSAIANSYATTGGRVMVPIPTKASLARDAISGGVVMLDKEIRRAAEADLTIVLGHSQGSQVATEWLELYDDINPAKLRFVLLGNPQRGKAFGAKGGVRWQGKLKPDTRNDTPYTVWDVARTGDQFAQPTGAWNGGLIHMSYNGVNLDTLETTKLSKTVVGNTTYYVVP